MQGGETAPPGGPVIASQEDRGAAPGTPAADEPGTARDARSAATATGASPLPPSAAPPAEKPDETPPRSVLRIEPAPALPAGPASVADAAPTNVRPHASTAVSAPAPPKTVRRPTAVVARAPGAYLVEAGVFNNAASAEEMRAMLTLSGIPARVEARVTVGPFRNREEAETAQARIRTLGVVAPDLVPLRK
ncbi:MAG: SPOR domain-containing protein [Betaproteobacteria bacterium]|nr:SPOR domain-containing protein [Betaproteobacteria bacterium]